MFSWFKGLGANLRTQEVNRLLYLISVCWNCKSRIRMFEKQIEPVVKLCVLCGREGRNRIRTFPMWGSQKKSTVLMGKQVWESLQFANSAEKEVPLYIHSEMPPSGHKRKKNTELKNSKTKIKHGSVCILYLSQIVRNSYSPDCMFPCQTCTKRRLEFGRCKYIGKEYKKFKE